MWSSLYAATAAATAAPAAAAAQPLFILLPSTSTLPTAASAVIDQPQPAQATPCPTALSTSSEAITQLRQQPSSIKTCKSTVVDDESEDLPIDDSTSKQFWCATCKKDFGRADILSTLSRKKNVFRDTDGGTRAKSRSSAISAIDSSPEVTIFDRIDGHYAFAHCWKIIDCSTHSGEKPYACELCDYKARRRDVLTRHMSARHQTSTGTKKKRRRSSSAQSENRATLKHERSASLDSQIVNEASENEDEEIEDELIDVV
ncbi:hypothetical protein PRIPAC_96625 [Pristionchus pacificus]|uniref:C2H2-type domain-containing protein n=1 Tax=Pristionchus pacificus TaxID=54126 RepID=A0A2A6BIN4_PRIPA|nr:hypothetical protein PRIPAC_96625 [Pristionchus pacificus]|eukprot:PDM65795.1 hypothetical protein PRIPAC_45196 [Pristionchus pacificus]